MKTIIRSQIINLTCVTVILLITGNFIQSCDSDNIIEKKVPSFLDFNDNLAPKNPQNLFILDEARKRIDPYVKIKENSIDLLISSGKDIGISDRIFKDIIKAVDKSNQMLKNKESLILDGEIISLNNEIDGLSILKTRSENDGYSSSSQEYWWGNITNTTYTQEGAYNYYRNYNNRNTALGAICTLASFGSVSNPATAAAFTYLGLVASGNSAIIADAIFAAARQGGFRVETTQRYYTTPGSMAISHAVYDHNGKLITTFYF